MIRAGRGPLRTFAQANRQALGVIIALQHRIDMLRL
jgi:hypothetical protein